MPFVSTREMLLDAQCGGYAVGAFNVENVEMAQAVIAVAEEMKAPVIDGSLLPYNGNVTLSRQAVAMACGIPVEAELGKVHGKIMLVNE